MEAVEGELVFAHVRVDKQRGFGVQGADAGEGRERDVDLIADAAHIEEDLIRALVSELAAERANHVRRLLISVRGVSTRGHGRGASRGNEGGGIAHGEWRGEG